MNVRRLGAIAAFAALVASVVGSVPGCGTDAVGTDVCKQVEEARCRRAPACAIALEPPYITSGTDVDSCIRFYDDACRHGLVAGDPGSTKASACVAAIQNDSPKTGCTAVMAPESDPACAWLIPTANVPDAATDAPTDARYDAGDAATD